MQRVNRIISTIITICFIFNTVLSDMALGQSLNYHPNTEKLATPSQFDDILNDLQRSDMGRIHGALILNIAEWLKHDISTLKDLIIPGKKISIFNPPDMQFFFSERETLQDGRLIAINCTIKDKTGKRTYYAVFPTDKDKISEIPVGVYAEEVYKKSEAFAKGLPKRSPEDAKAIARYSKQNEEIIDKFIRKRIESGYFAEIERRAEGLGWDEKYPDRVKPKLYWPTHWLESVKSRLDPFLMPLGTNVDKALRGKNIVFVRIPKNGYPGIKEDRNSIVVASHMSANALYLFIPAELFNGYSWILTRNDSKPRSKIVYSAEDADIIIRQIGEII